MAGIAQVHHGLQIQVQVGVRFAAGGDDVTVAVEGHRCGHAVVGVAVVAGALHGGFHLAHQRGGVFQITRCVDAAGGRDAAQLRVLQQLAKIEPAHREGAQQRLPAIGLRRPQLAAEREVAVAGAQLQVGIERQRGRPAPEGAAERQRGRNADIIRNAALRREAQNIGPRGAELLNIQIGIQPRIDVGQALNAAAPGLEHRIAQAHKLEIAHREIAHAAGNLPIQQHRLVGAGIERGGARQLRGQVQNVAEAQAHLAQIARNLQVGQLLYVAQRRQAFVADGQRAPDAGVRRYQIEAVEANLHRVVHHVGPPLIHPKAALLAAGQVVDAAGGAVFRVADVVRVQRQVRKIEVIVVERG